MKKAFLLLTALVALTGAVWLNVGASDNALIKADVYSQFFTDVQPGQHVPAQYYNSMSDLRELPCMATETPGRVSCQFPVEYAGQQVPVQLTKNGVMYVSIVDVPSR